MTQNEVVEYLKNMQEVMDVLVKDPENAAEQLAFNGANGDLGDAIKATEFDARPGDGWSKWMRVANCLRSGGGKILALYPDSPMGKWMLDFADVADPSNKIGDDERPDCYPGVR